MLKQALAPLRSLRWRLALFNCALVAALLIAVGFFVYSRFEAALKQDVAQRLQDQASLIQSSALAQDPGGLNDPKLTASVISQEALLSKGNDSTFIGLYDQAGNVIVTNQITSTDNKLSPNKVLPSGSAVPVFATSPGQTGQSAKAIRISALSPELQPFAPAKRGTPISDASYSYESTIHVISGNDATTAPGLVVIVPLYPPDPMQKMSQQELDAYLQKLKMNGVSPPALTPATNYQPLAYLALATRLTDVDDSLAQLRVILIMGVLGAFGLALLLGIPLARFGLRPLQRIAATASEIGNGDLSRRVALPDNYEDAAHDEIGQLTQAFNAMLDKIESSFEAQRRSEARTKQFAADASHELRSPLTVLGGYLDVLLMGAKDDPIQTERILLSMQNENSRLGRLVVDLLLLTRIDANGASLLRMQPVLLRDVAERAIDNMRLISEDRVLELHADDALYAHVAGDPDHLYRVLANLLDNAIRYTPPDGHIAVTLALAEDLGRVSLTVQDDGCGIAPEDLPHIFDRFYRADPSRTRQTGNAGLGLAIARTIVEAHGGHIAVESHPGCGTLFVIDLPLLRNQRSQNSQQTLSLLSAQPKAGHLH